MLTFSFSVIWGYTIASLFYNFFDWSSFFHFKTASAPGLCASHQQQEYERSSHLNGKG